MKKKNKVLKVLQVIPKLGYVGAETGCYDLAHFLPEENCKSFIVTSGGELLKHVNKEKVKIFRLPVHSKNPLLILINSIIISLIIIFYNINIVHARSRAPAWSCLIATKLTVRKFVTTFHGTYNFNNKLKKFYNSVMVRSNLVIAGSNFIFSHVNDNYGNFFTNNKRILMVIFRGINTNYYNPQKISPLKIEKFSKLWNIDRNKFIILLPGRLTYWKGQKIFIEALKLIAEQDNNQPFEGIILGGDQGRKIFKKKLQRLVEQHRLIEEVIFIDNFNIMPLAYKISDVIFSCSIEPEAFGRVSVEAQSMEKPIIASNIGGSLETIKHEKTGFLFSAGDINDLYKNMSEIFDLYPATLEVMGTEGRKNVIKKFNVEKMCFSTYSEYKKLIN